LLSDSSLTLVDFSDHNGLSAICIVLNCCNFMNSYSIIFAFWHVAQHWHLTSSCFITK